MMMKTILTFQISSMGLPQSHKEDRGRRLRDPSVVRGATPASQSGGLACRVCAATSVSLRLYTSHFRALPHWTEAASGCCWRQYEDTVLWVCIF